MRKIIIGVGHNYANGDKGATFGGLHESDICFEIQKALKKKGINGFQVINCPIRLTIPQRNAFINANEPEFYLELHMDSFPTEKGKPPATGATTFYVGGNSWAEKQAKVFQDEYSKEVKLRNRGIKPDTASRFKRLGAIRDNKHFSLLLEMGFITNKDDVEAVYKHGIDAIAKAITKMFSNF